MLEIRFKLALVVCALSAVSARAVETEGRVPWPKDVALQTTIESFHVKLKDEDALLKNNSAAWTCLQEAKSEIAESMSSWTAGKVSRVEIVFQNGVKDRICAQDNCSDRLTVQNKTLTLNLRRADKAVGPGGDIECGLPSHDTVVRAVNESLSKAAEARDLQNRNPLGGNGYSAGEWKQSGAAGKPSAPTHY
jgi:hypothetical protein